MFLYVSEKPVMDDCCASQKSIAKNDSRRECLIAAGMRVMDDCCASYKCNKSLAKE